MCLGHILIFSTCHDFIRCSTLFYKPLKCEPKSYSKYIYLTKVHILPESKRKISTHLSESMPINFGAI